MENMKNSCGGRGCRVTHLPKDNKIKVIKNTCNGRGCRIIRLPYFSSPALLT